MALKDWTMIALTKEHYKFENRNGRRIYIAKQTMGDKWYVEFAWSYHNYKLFKTESQALKFARQYMRTN